MNLKTLLVLFIVVPLCFFIAENALSVIEHPSKKNFSKNYLPKIKKKDQIIKHAAFTLCYQEEYEQAKWVAYRLTDSMCNNNREERSNDFRVDKNIKTGSASPDDYKKSGYDRGHLCPAGDMSWSNLTMSESFLMSNMSPQAPKFNRGIWKILESDVREWAKKNKEIFIVTAGVLQENLETIGENKVSVPKYYYKVILDYRLPDYKAIAFVLPNDGSTESVFNYAVSIDSVEHLTGIDFFPALPDVDENNLEANFNMGLWK